MAPPDNRRHTSHKNRLTTTRPHSAGLHRAERGYADRHQPERPTMTLYIDDDHEPGAHADTLLGRSAPGLSPEAADSVRSEMARREAAGLPAVPDMSWDD